MCWPFLFFTIMIFNHLLLTSSWTQTSHPEMLKTDFRSYNYFLNSTGFILKRVIRRCASLFWQWSREAGQMGHIRKTPLQHILYYFTPLCMCSGMASVSHFWHSSRIWTLEMKWGLLFEVFCLSFLPFEKSVPSSLLASSSTILLQIIIDLCSS